MYVCVCVCVCVCIQVDRPIVRYRCIEACTCAVHYDKEHYDKEHYDTELAPDLVLRKGQREKKWHDTEPM